MRLLDFLKKPAAPPPLKGATYPLSGNLPPGRNGFERPQDENQSDPLSLSLSPPPSESSAVPVDHSAPAPLVPRFKSKPAEEGIMAVPRSPVVSSRPVVPVGIGSASVATPVALASSRVRKARQHAKGPPVSYKRPRPVEMVMSPPPPSAVGEAQPGSRPPPHLTSPPAHLPAPPGSPLPLSLPSVDRHGSITTNTTTTTAAPLTRFVDVLDRQSEIRRTDFRSRVNAAGARDYGEDVAERNIGENGLDLTSPPVRAFYGARLSDGSSGKGGDEDRREGEGEGEGEGEDLPLRKAIRGVVDDKMAVGVERALAEARPLCARRSRSLTGLVLSSAMKPLPPAPITPPLPPTTTITTTTTTTTTTPVGGRGHIRRQSYAMSWTHQHGPPSIISTAESARPGTAPHGMTPPAIPDHTPQISPRMPRDSLLLAKEKQHASSSVSPASSASSMSFLSHASHGIALPNPNITGVGARPKSAGNPHARRRAAAAAAAAMAMPHLPPLLPPPPARIGGAVGFPKHRSMSSINGEYARRRAPPVHVNVHEEYEPESCAPSPRIMRSMNPINAAHVHLLEDTSPPPYSHAAPNHTLVLGPGPGIKPALRLEELYGHVPPRHSSAQHWSVASTPLTTASTPSSESCHAIAPLRPEDTAADPGSRWAESGSSRRSTIGSIIAAPDCPTLENRLLPPPPGAGTSPSFTSTYANGAFSLDDYISSDDESLYSPETPGAILALRVRRHPHRRRRRRDGEDTGLLFRDAGYGSGDAKQLPGLFDSMPETGIATAMPLTSHPIPRLMSRPISVSSRGGGGGGGAHPARSVPGLILDTSSGCHHRQHHNDDDLPERAGHQSCTGVAYGLTDDDSDDSADDAFNFHSHYGTEMEAEHGLTPPPVLDNPAVRRVTTKGRALTAPKESDKIMVEEWTTTPELGREAGGLSECEFF